MFCNRKQLRKTLAVKRDSALAWIAREALSRLSSKGRCAILIPQIKLLQKTEIVQVFGQSLSVAMIRDLVSLTQNSISAEQRAQAAERHARAEHWDNIIKLRANK